MLRILRNTKAILVSESSKKNAEIVDSFIRLLATKLCATHVLLLQNWIGTFQVNGFASRPIVLSCFLLQKSSHESC